MSTASRTAARLLAAVVAAASACALAGPAAADPLEETRARYDHVESQITRLDARTERLTEEWNRARWQVDVLRRRVEESRAELAQARADLVHGRAVLADLLVARYKRGDTGAIDVVLGADSLPELTSGLDVQERFDAAYTQAVLQVEAAEARIERELEALEADQARMEAEVRILRRNRRHIERRLVERQELLGRIGLRRDVLEAAVAIGRTLEADEARRWLRADMRLNRDNPEVVLGDRIALESLEQLGVPYVWGGASPEGGFDCSGLVSWLWAQHGYALPHYAAAQFHTGPAVDRDELRPGDLVFFHDLGHVALYIGNGFVVHAPHTGDVVRIAPLSTPWFEQTYVGAIRPEPLVG